jgi:hypothetical protein
MSEQKNIYVVVAATVQHNDRSIVQVPGRQFAQGCHATSKLRIDNRIFDWEDDLPIFTPITTITKSCRDSNELAHVEKLLIHGGIMFSTFYDTNVGVYGPGEVATAIAAYMTEIKGKSLALLGYLPLWDGK